MHTHAHTHVENSHFVCHEWKAVVRCLMSRTHVENSRHIWINKVYKSEKEPYWSHVTNNHHILRLEKRSATHTHVKSSHRFWDVLFPFPPDVSCICSFVILLLWFKMGHVILETTYLHSIRLPYRHFKHPHLFIHQHPRSLLTLDAREFRSQCRFVAHLMTY